MTWVLILQINNLQNVSQNSLIITRSRNFNYICIVSQFSTIRNTLKQLKPELIEKYHISTLGLFGSIVRDDFNASSDVDIIVDFTQPIGIEFIELADLIERKIKKSVDLVSKKGIKQKYYKEIESEIIYV